MTRDIAIGTETAKTDTANATSVGGTGLSSPHHSTAASGTPRGIRNNNPLNIRYNPNNNWQGRVLQVNGVPKELRSHGESGGTGCPNDDEVVSQCNPVAEREFEQFISMEYGFRAALLTIETYILKYGCNTIRKIIYRWAPPSSDVSCCKECAVHIKAAERPPLQPTQACVGCKKRDNTEKYIQDVCRMTNIGGEEPLSNHDRRLKGIVAAMARVESGAGIVDYQSSLDKAFDAFVPREQTEKEYKKRYS